MKHSARHNDNSCSVCSNLSEHEYGFQKYGWEEDNTYLPESADQLLLVQDLKPNNSRSLQIRQCPECRAYFLYRTDYEYLAGGSEDEQILDRLTDTEARQYFQGNVIK